MLGWLAWDSPGTSELMYMAAFTCPGVKKVEPSFNVHLLDALAKAFRAGHEAHCKPLNRAESPDFTVPGSCAARAGPQQRMCARSPRCP